MNKLKIGDIVTRKSYGCDICFKIVDIKRENNENIVTLKGIDYRLLADSPESDLILQLHKNDNEFSNRCINL
jgi:spore coat assemly protein